MPDPTLVRTLEERALSIRKHLLTMASGGQLIHLGGSTSIADLMAALLLHYLDLEGLERPKDHFILSKGHTVHAFHACLAELGKVEPSEFSTLGQTGTRLAGHPSLKAPLVEFATGSLGHGLSVGIGIALAEKLDGRASRTVVLMGDGELQEGSVWEAALCAPLPWPGRSPCRGSSPTRRTSGAPSSTSTDSRCRAPEQRPRLQHRSRVPSGPLWARALPNTWRMAPCSGGPGVALGARVDGETSGGLLRLATDGEVALVAVRQGQEKLLDEVERRLPAGEVTVALSVSGRHWKGFVDGGSVVHGHASLPAPGRMALLLDGTGTLRVVSVRVTPMNGMGAAGTSSGEQVDQH